MFEIAPTTEILARALDVCALRQAVYSANIANANVDGYRRLEVLFDPQAMNASTGEKLSTLNTLAVSNAPLDHRIVATSQSVKLDEEMALMARNGLRYQTLLSAYERSASLVKTAVHEGRGV